MPAVHRGRAGSTLWWKQEGSEVQDGPGGGWFLSSSGGGASTGRRDAHLRPGGGEPGEGRGQGG